MKLKTIIILLSIPFLSYCQNINDCYPRLKPIVDYRGLEVGKACRYFDPIQIKEKEINIGEFYQITPNWKQKRIYVTDIIRKGRDIVGGERFLKIFNFKGEIIFNTKKNQSNKVSRGKTISVASDGKVLFWEASWKTDSTIFEIVKIRDKNGNEILSREIELLKYSIAYLKFDLNKNGDFVVVFRDIINVDETKKNNWKIHSYNIRGELKWEKDYKSESISDIAINDKGHFVILEKANKPFISENKISLMDKNGNLIKEMGLDFHLNRVEFKNKKNIVLWNWLERNHYKMEIKIIK